MAGSTSAPTFDMKLGGTRVWDDAGMGCVPFSGRSSSQLTDHREEKDPEALTWATHEKQLPPYTAILAGSLNVTSNGEGPRQQKHVDVRKLSRNERASILAKAFDTSERDNEQLLQSFRNRIDRVGIKLPKVEVRFQDLHVSAQVYVGGRALPSLWNFVRNMVEACLSACRLLPSEKCDLDILQDVSGVIKPGRMTLLLGPPGCGKSTLLMALAGKLDSSLRKSGLITYNGLTLKEFVPQSTASYISQTDNHIGELTVRETLDFAARCQGVGYKQEMMAELARKEKAHQIRPDPDIDAYMKASAVEGKKHSVSTDYIMKILGLEHCADTVVGDEMLRGISGGQKKRVTTGEMVVGPKNTLFMDEISTGLDSSTTFHIVKCTRNFVHLHDATVLMALLQPPPETFDLFDDILLLAKGHVVYLGPRERVLEFFESLGFKLPPRKGVADFLREVTSKKDQAQYWADKSRAYKYIPVSAMAAAFQESEVGRKLKTHLATPFDVSKGHPRAIAKTKYALSKWERFKACFERELLLMKRNSCLYVCRTAQAVLLAFLTATLFMRTNLQPTDENDGNLYMNCLFFSLLDMVFNGLSEMAMTVMRLQVFYKQRDNLFYPAWAFSIPTWILRLPYSAVEAVIWSSIVYYTVGLAPDATRFFRFTLLLFLMHQVSVGLFRTIGALGRSMVIANTLGSFVVRLLFLLGGFILAKSSIHPWWVWGYWVSPLTYAQIAISVNEFLAPRWQMPSPDAPGVPLYRRILGARGMPMEGYWYWIGVAVLLGYILFLNFTATLALSYFGSIGKPQAVVTEETLREKTEDTTDQLPDRGAGNGVVSLENKGESTKHVVESSLETGGSIELGLVAKQHEGVLEVHVDVQQLTETKTSQGMILPFKPLALSFHNVCYYVDVPPEMQKEGLKESKMQLLKSVSGAFRPGVLTALVGVSGAGKTTLMDVLAGRKTGGRITGEIRVSGYPKVQATFARVTGYVEQTDIHSPQVTVHESLLYSSWLRLPDDVDTQTRHAFVEEVMELVELAPLRHALVGLPGSTGLSTEQRKRLTIAVELVANPSIIFMDEPTSGLDARAAAIVMRTVRNTVDTGRTVVCTIHQPSVDIFDAFDELLLMERGGTVIYAGPLGHHSQQLIDYFESINEVPPIKDGYNPATWMLEVTTPASEQRIGQGFADIYKNSELFRLNESLIDQLSVPAPGTEYLNFPTEYPRSSATLLVACLWKQHWTYWRSPHYNCVRFAFTVIGSLMFGTIFWGLGKKRETCTQQDVFNVMGALYSAVLFLGVCNASAVQPVVAIERAVFNRERAAAMYSPFPYALAQGLIEIPYILLQTVVYTIITYSMIQFEWTVDKFFWHMLFMGLSFAYFTFFGMMAVGLTASQQLTAVISSAFFSMWNLFAGFIIPQPRIPGWWIWNYWLCPISWTLHGLVSSQLGDVTTRIEDKAGTPTVAAFVESYFGYKNGMLGLCAVVLASFGFLFWFMFALSIKHINFQRR